MRFKVQEANSVLYKKQKEAEPELYENRKAAELFYVYEDQATANMMYRVARASEFLVITGIGIDELKITKKALIWPLQKCRVIDVTPVNYTFEVNAMSAEKLPFLLPAVFTIGQCVDDRERLIKYA